MKAPVGSPREGNDAPKVDFAARLDALEFALSTLRGGARTLRWALAYERATVEFCETDLHLELPEGDGYNAETAYQYLRRLFRGALSADVVDTMRAEPLAAAAKLCLFHRDVDALTAKRIVTALEVCGVTWESILA